MNFEDRSRAMTDSDVFVDEGRYFRSDSPRTAEAGIAVAPALRVHGPKERKLPTYFENQIKHISDEDLFSALKLELPELVRVRAAVREANYDAAFEAWHSYLKNRLSERPPAWDEDPRTISNPSQIVAEADLVVKRDIKCWGGVRIQYDGEIDFSRNLGGSSNYGFHYFGWMSPVAAAYRLTHDEKYARTFVEIFMRWYRQREAVKSDIEGLDVIWYELGMTRARVFTDHYFATIHSKSANDPEYHRMFMKTILGHARWLYGHETAYRPGNWQVCGAQTLTGLGISFPEFRTARMWQRRGLKWILAHIRKDVYADGCHKERAPSYHLGVVGSFRDVHRSLAGAPGIDRQRDEIGSVIERMLLWTLGTQTPGGHSPTIGDSEYDLPREQYLQIGLVQRNSELVWASGASEEMILNAAKQLGTDRPVAGRKPKRASVHFASSGFAIVRGGWEAEDLYFCVNYGPYGGGHSHDEALAFQMWSCGRPLAVDCGRGISYDDPLHGPWYKSVYAHNMVAVDGSAPSVQGRKGKLCYWVKTTDADLLGLSHRGYEGIGVRHLRCVLTSREIGYAVILDFLTSRGDHTYECIVNTPHTMRVKRSRVEGSGLTILEAEQATPSRISQSTVQMALPLEGRSTWGMEREEGTNLRLEKHGTSVEYAVLIAPFGEDVTLEVTTGDAASRYRKVISVAGPGFNHRYRVDCMNGELEAGR